MTGVRTTQPYRRMHLALLVLLVLAQGGLSWLFFSRTRAMAVGEAERVVHEALLTQRAIHAYVEQVQKPELFRLMQEKKLYPDYFSPKLLSRTYIGRGVGSFLNAERRRAELPEITFKVASDNARNPLNGADPVELDLLHRMNEGGIKEFKQVVTRQGESQLYYAIPISPNEDSCLRCHGDPAEAPRELVKKYGTHRGFNEQTGRIRALISIRVPLTRELAAARETAWLLSGAALSALLGLYVLIAFFIRRLQRQESDLRETNALLEQLSAVDPLTGLLNRQRFAEETEEMLAQVRHCPVPLSLILLDVDWFKRVNDAHGHAAGDQVLTRLAVLLREHTRATDRVARWGGEEFMIAAPGTSGAQALELAEKLRALVAAAEMDGHPVTASFGVASWREGDSFESLVERADGALYEAKRSGRNRVCAEVA